MHRLPDSAKRRFKYGALSVAVRSPAAFCATILTVLFSASAFVFPQDPERVLEIHFIDVGQGDAALLIAPNGETVLFDNGVRNDCHRPLAYLDQLGITEVTHHIASHYHDDHIGCTNEVFSAVQLLGAAFDRGGDYHTRTYERYEAMFRAQRREVMPGERITLDSGEGTPVFIDILAVNGHIAGDANPRATKNENDMSVVSLVRFGLFDALLGGDLSGARTSSYRDIETFLADVVGAVEVYKVHHHGSRHSSNPTLLAAITPLVGIISAGLNNKHGHPTADSLERLHGLGTRAYWTTAGSGQTQARPGLDVVAGHIIVSVAEGADRFSIAYGNHVDTYLFHEAENDLVEARFAWSVRSRIYHFSHCDYVQSISPQNLDSGPEPPEGKTLHEGCPRRFQ